MLALLAPVVLIVALRVRAARPSEVAPALTQEVRAGLGAVADLDGAPLLLPLKLAVRVSVDGPGGARLLELQPEEPLLEPDVLVYAVSKASARAGTTDTALPADARLLGALSGTLARRWTLPADANEWWLYSLGHQTVLAREALPAAGGAR